MDAVRLAEKRMIPDMLIRKGIRRHLARRLEESTFRDPNARQAEKKTFIESLALQPLALNTDDANRQHYEVPAEFFRVTLGPHLKYSCCLFADGKTKLVDAEQAMLVRTCERAELKDGMDVLELGCGWGSLTIWMARNYPSSRITAVSNSSGQRRAIESRCVELGLSNVKVLTANMVEFDTNQRFDRVVSVEMFEHMRNLELLMRRISGWLRPAGKLFVHIFCHRDSPYLFADDGPSDWLGRNFFSGGMMPSEDLLLHFQKEVTLERRWCVNGLHYWRTCEQWLRNLDAHKFELTNLFARLHGQQSAAILLQRWRIFFMACAELFRYRSGSEWYVGHYLFQNRGTSSERRAAPGRPAALTAGV